MILYRKLNYPLSNREVTKIINIYHFCHYPGEKYPFKFLIYMFISKRVSCMYLFEHKTVQITTMNFKENYYLYEMINYLCYLTPPLIIIQ